MDNLVNNQPKPSPTADYKTFAAFFFGAAAITALVSSLGYEDSLYEKAYKNVNTYFSSISTPFEKVKTNKTFFSFIVKIDIKGTSLEFSESQIELERRPTSLIMNAGTYKVDMKDLYFPVIIEKNDNSTLSVQLSCKDQKSCIDNWVKDSNSKEDFALIYPKISKRYELTQKNFSTAVEKVSRKAKKERNKLNYWKILDGQTERAFVADLNLVLAKNGAVHRP